MKKLFLVICAALSMVICGTAESKAQCAFPDGSLGINLGLGVGHNYWHHGWDDVFIPSFNAAVDYAFLPNIINSHGAISGGGYFGIGQGSTKHGDGKHIANQFKLGTRGALHYTWVNNLDTYAGVAIGYKHEGHKWKDTNTKTKSDPETRGDFDMYGFGGVRLKLGNFALYSELSTTSFAWFQIGVSFIL